MPNFIELTVIGHAGQNAVVARDKNGKEYARISIATTGGKKGNEKTYWTNIVVFNEYLVDQAREIVKGNAVFARGLPFASKYVNKAQATIPTLNMYANDLYKILWKKREERLEEEYQGENEQPEF